MRSLDYASPRPGPRRRRIFWLVFLPTYLPGLMLLDITDDVIHRRLTGHPNDGDILFLGLFACPLFVSAAGILKSLWRRCDTPWFAAASAFLAPAVAYLIWVALGTVR